MSVLYIYIDMLYTLKFLNWIELNLQLKFFEKIDKQAGLTLNP